MSSSPALAPMDHEAAERIALAALRPGARMLVGPRVLMALLNRITELGLAEAMLRVELDRREARELEDARLRAHAMWSQQGGADR